MICLDSKVSMGILVRDELESLPIDRILIGMFILIYTKIFGFLVFVVFYLKTLKEKNKYAIIINIIIIVERGDEKCIMKKIRNSVILTVFVILLVFLIPIIINELYKMNNGYMTLWDAADVLSYYGAVLQGIFSMVALFFTILYTRKQIKYEHFEYTQREKIDNIVCDFLNFVELLYPLRLFKIKLLYGSEGRHSGKILDEILIYQIELKILGNKIKHSINLDGFSEIDEFMSNLLAFADKLIDSANRLYLCYSEIIVDKNVKDNYKCIEVECENLQRLTNTEYQRILTDKEMIFLKLEKKLEDNLSKIIDF